MDCNNIVGFWCALFWQRKAHWICTPVIWYLVHMYGRQCLGLINRSQPWCKGRPICALNKSWGWEQTWDKKNLQIILRCFNRGVCVCVCRALCLPHRQYINNNQLWSRWSSENLMHSQPEHYLQLLFDLGQGERRNGRYPRIRFYFLAVWRRSLTFSQLMTFQIAFT